MQRITLPKIHACLRDLRHEIVIAPDVLGRARAALERMLAVGRQERV
jgi:quinolinate synthase